ncbi:MAG: DeoR/GlpR family DNA-binding transcription regulator [Planctomycetota bacterium]|jgi:DeoR/GlpR family transcriptional regulator of sugar metabolism
MNNRQEKLLELLKEKGELDVSQLSTALSASEATIRRDLIAMEKDSLIIRTLGGAKPQDARSIVAETFGEKQEKFREEKERIARKAAELVSPGMTIAIDSGSTAWRLSASLKDKGPLIVITSALAAVEELGPVEGMKVYCSGGQFRSENLDFTGTGNWPLLEKMRADIAFISCDALIPGKGAYSRDESSSETGSALSNLADRTIVICDHSKFDKKSCSYRIIADDVIDAIVTDSGINKESAEQLSKSCELILAD